MHRKAFHIFALALFTLLQALAPLLHAHIGAPHYAGIHMPAASSVARDESGALRQRAGSALLAAVVEVGAAAKGREWLTPLPSPPDALAQALHTSNAARLTLAQSLDFYRAAPVTRARFTLPFAQAPPTGHA